MLFIVFWVVAAVLAALVGCVELLTRYRDEPFKTVSKVGYSWLYIGFNGLVGVVAFAILVSAQPEISTVWSENDSKVENGVDQGNGDGQQSKLAGALFLYAISAAFGGALVLRSRVITIRSGNQDISIGPSVIIDQFLAILDRQIDRRRALDRRKIVRDAMGQIDYSKVAPHILNNIINGLQNMTADEREDLVDQLDKIRNNETLENNQEKCYALGYLTLDFMGDEFLTTLFDDGFREEFKLTDVGMDEDANTVQIEPDDLLERDKLIKDLLEGVTYGAVFTKLEESELLTSSQLSSEKIAELESKISEIKESSQSEEEKAVSLGFAILDAAGTEFLEDNFIGL